MIAAPISINLDAHRVRVMASRCMLCAFPIGAET